MKWKVVLSNESQYFRLRQEAAVHSSWILPLNLVMMTPQKSLIRLVIKHFNVSFDVKHFINDQGFVIVSQNNECYN